MYQLEDDVGRLHDEFLRLETRLKCCLSPCGAAGRKRDKEVMWSFYIQVESLEVLVSWLEAKPIEKHLHAAFANAAHTGCQDTTRSTSGSMQLLGIILVSWSSKKQKSTAISSTEAE
ncbi:hypothetical protein Tco_0303467 [Tanacetum coccineum]